MHTFLKKYLLNLIILLSFFIPNFVKAEGYKIYLYYDEPNNILSLDKNINPNIVLDPKISDEDTYQGMISRGVEGDKDWENESNKYKFYIDFVGNDGTYKHNFAFNPEIGSFEIVIPYLNWVQELSIKSMLSQTNVLSLDVRNFANCNQNLICESELNEDSVCTPDCINYTGDPIVYSDKTQEEFNQGNGFIKDDQGIVVLTRLSDNNQDNDSIETNQENPPIWPLILGIVLLIIGLGVFIYFRIKKKNRVINEEKDNL